MRSPNGHGRIHVAPQVTSPPDSASVRRVLFVGKNMSRSRCTGGLVDALRQHGLTVKWINMATLRRWLGEAGSVRRAQRVFDSFAPDLVFVFCRDLPVELLREFRRGARVLLWVEELLANLERSQIEYMKNAHLVCMSNPRHRVRLRREGVPRVEFLMSGFSPRFHWPVRRRKPQRDVVFIGGPGTHGQRAHFLARVSQHFDTEIYGVPADWRPWVVRYPQLRVRHAVGSRGYRRLCATSRIVLGLNERNSEPQYFSNRTFLTLACEGFHLTRYVPSLEAVFTNGVHLAWYRDIDHCLDQIEHYLADEELRLRIARAGRELVLAQHQYYHRVSRILELLGEPPAAAIEPEPLRAIGAAARAGW